ncbi:MAG: N-6 DNA methylase, partial [Prevotella sp.]|nr:N-6 DNA methylase [Prevotella sp.]
MAYNKRQKLQDNIAAIRTVFQLEKEGRAATDAEREVLKRYSGFGGLKFVLKPTGSDADKQYWNQSELTYFDQTKELFDTIREGASDDKEAKELTDSIKRSVNTAFYTPAPVIGAIAKVMKDAGVEVRSMLDPSAGIGKFGDAFKGEYPDVRVSAFEKDLLTGRILKALNPHDSVTIDGFETIKPELKGTFDVATSNIPFGDIKVMDDEYRKSGNDAKRYAVSTIHNYFFLKALDQVREGGFVAFITSRGFMDSPSNNPIREELARNARLVGAFRLPDGMFRDEAGTDVGSDLVVLQKYTGYDMSLDPDTQAFCDVDKGFKAMSGEDWTDISMNCHWWKSMMAPDSEAIVATKWEKGTDPYGKPTLVFTHDGGMDDIAKQLTEYFKRDLYSDYVDYYKANAPVAQQQEPEPVEEIVSSEPVQLDLFAMWDAEATLQSQPQQQPVHQEKPKELSMDEQRMNLYYQIRDAYEELYDTEAQSREEQPELRERLNKVYDEFVEKFGRLNERKNARAIMTDAKGRDVLTLENAVDKTFVKADIFDRPVSFVAYEISHVDTPEEALFASLNRYGQVDLEYMAGITGHTQGDLVNELKGRIYYMPDGSYEISSKALSGNVYDKLAYVNDA